MLLVKHFLINKLISTTTTYSMTANPFLECQYVPEYNKSNLKRESLELTAKTSY